MRTQIGHDKGEWLVPRTVRCYMAIDFDKSTNQNLTGWIHRKR